MSVHPQNLAAIAIALIGAPLLEAAVGHTWVAGDGSDANPCSVAQPCATFQGAIAATTAGGMISVLRPGDFGPVTINHAVTIDGGAVGGTVTFTANFGITVNAGISDTVILRHLAVNGLDMGADPIWVEQARQVIIEDCDLESFYSVGLVIEGPVTPTYITVKNTRIIGSGTGVYAYKTNAPPNIFVSLRNVVISCATGAIVVNSTMEITDSLITQNQVGFSATGNAFMNVANSAISYNTTDVQTSTGGVVFLSDNNTLFGNNGTLGPPAGPSTVSRPEAFPHVPLPPPVDPGRQRQQ